MKPYSEFIQGAIILDLESVILLGALKLFCQRGPSRQNLRSLVRSGSVLLSELIPLVFCKIENIQDQILDVHARFPPLMTEITAWLAYIRVCRQREKCPILYFLVEECKAGATQKYTLGVARDVILRLSYEKTEILGAYPLESLRRRSASLGTLSLDFASESFVFLTDQGDSIVNSIEGSIEQLLQQKFEQEMLASQTGAQAQGSDGPLAQNIQQYLGKFDQALLIIASQRSELRSYSVADSEFHLLITALTGATALLDQVVPSSSPAMTAQVENWPSQCVAFGTEILQAVDILRKNDTARVRPAAQTLTLGCINLLILARAAHNFPGFGTGSTMSVFLPIRRLAVSVSKFAVLRSDADHFSKVSLVLLQIGENAQEIIRIAQDESSNTYQNHSQQANEIIQAADTLFELLSDVFLEFRHLARISKFCQPLANSAEVVAQRIPEIAGLSKRTADCVLLAINNPHVFFHLSLACNALRREIESACELLPASYNMNPASKRVFDAISWLLAVSERALQDLPVFSTLENLEGALRKLCLHAQSLLYDRGSVISSGFQVPGLPSPLMALVDSARDFLAAIVRKTTAVAVEENRPAFFDEASTEMTRYIEEIAAGDGHTLGLSVRNKISALVELARNIVEQQRKHEMDSIFNDFSCAVRRSWMISRDPERLPSFKLWAQTLFKIREAQGRSQGPTACSIRTEIFQLVKSRMDFPEPRELDRVTAQSSTESLTRLKLHCCDFLCRTALEDISQAAIRSKKSVAVGFVEILSQARELNDTVCRIESHSLNPTLLLKWGKAVIVEAGEFVDAAKRYSLSCEIWDKVKDAANAVFWAVVDRINCLVQRPQRRHLPGHTVGSRGALSRSILVFVESVHALVDPGHPNRVCAALAPWRTIIPLRELCLGLATKKGSLSVFELPGHLRDDLEARRNQFWWLRLEGL
eukprot:TRINITY_DN7008_c0_g2_i3.p1 TRINITY_DN7008_c0_g2~~TRINITY_DN7008_c0_g2_i3.p1  ORF type:complete len:934 (+),score=133.62 TRINITY_DN7008_c0_g2_i3:564-3365(+)